jgi:hypothetical protein
MTGSVRTALKRFILWDYPRSSWQYEAMVTLILVFIFLTPRAFFGDQPRPKNVTLLSSSSQGSSFMIDPELLTGVPETHLAARVAKLIHSQAGNRNRSVERIEPVYDKDEMEIRAYIVYTRP